MRRKLSITRLTTQGCLHNCLYLFKICLFFLCPLNRRVIKCKAFFQKHTAQIKNTAKAFAGLLKHVWSTLSCLFLSVPKKFDIIKVSHKFSVKWRTDYNLVQRKLGNILPSCLIFVGLTVFWSWLELSSTSINFMFASYEWLLWVKLLEGELVNFIVCFLFLFTKVFQSFHPRVTVLNFSWKIRKLFQINM